nr:sugar transport protein 14-like [Tanacetum cinerariifolium]
MVVTFNGGDSDDVGVVVGFRGGGVRWWLERDKRRQMCVLFMCVFYPFVNHHNTTMAGGAMVDGKGGARAELYEHKITSYFVFACIFAALGGSLFGYDLGVSGGVTSMDYFLKEFFPKIYRRKQEHLKETDYCKYDNQILTLFTSSLYFAALVSTFFASHVTRNKGRRASILCGAVSFFAGAFMNAGAQNIAMLIIGRCLLGAVPLYLSEMAPAKIRGKVNQLFQLTTCLGIFIANFINNATEKHSWGWRLSLGLAAVPATLMFVGGWFLPETPNSLVEQGRLEEGRRVLEKVRGTKNVEAEFQDLLEASEVAKAIKHPFRNLLERKNRPQLIIGALGIPAFQQLTGMNSVLFYAPVIFQSLGFGSGASLWSSTITSGTLVVATFISMAFADKFGRRALFLEAAYGRSWGPLGWLVPSELFPLETRSAGQSIVVCVNMFFTALVAQCFLVSLCHLRYGIFLLFGGLIVVMSIFIYLFLPETKQVPIEETYLLWQNHWFWKSYCVPEDHSKEKGMKPV